MDGFEVISVNDDKCIGHAAGQIGEYVIVEHGHLRKTRSPLPLSFATVDEANQRVVTTLSHDIVYDAPPVKDGELDEHATALHYGLAQAEVGSPDVEERTDAIEEVSSGVGANDRAGAPMGQSPALLGDRDRRNDENSGAL